MVIRPYIVGQKIANDYHYIMCLDEWGKYVIKYKCYYGVIYTMQYEFVLHNM